MSGSLNKACERCGKTFSKMPKMSFRQWIARRFCSKRCAGMRRKQTDQQILDWYSHGHSSNDIADLTGLSQVQISRIVAAYGQTRLASDRIRRGLAKPEVRRRMSSARKGVACQESVKDALRKRTGSLNHNWRGGITSSSGYLMFTASPANGENARRFLHAVIAEWKLGRSLKENEVVHHKDGNKMNNDPGNLEVLTPSAHARLHAIQNQLGKTKCLEA